MGRRGPVACTIRRDIGLTPAKHVALPNIPVLGANPRIANWSDEKAAGPDVCFGSIGSLWPSAKLLLISPCKLTRQPSEHVSNGPIVLKNSKIAGLQNLANVACGGIQQLQGHVKSIRAPAGIFAVIDVVPRIEASEAHQRL